MISMSPKSSPQDESGVFGLMAFLADPKKTAARAEELRELAADADAKLAAAKAETAAAQRMLDEAVAAQTAAEAAQKAAKDAQEAVAARTAALDKREKEIKIAEQTFIQAKDRIAAEQRAAAADLTDREKAVTAAAEAATKAQAKADAVIAEYEAKIEQLRKIAG